MTDSTPRELTREVAGILRAARARKNVSQKVLADAVGVSQSQLSKMLRGLRPITIDQLKSMCEVLHLELPAVVTEAAEETNARNPREKT